MASPNPSHIGQRENNNDTTAPSPGHRHSHSHSQNLDLQSPQGAAAMETVNRTENINNNNAVQPLLPMPRSKRMPMPPPGLPPPIPIPILMPQNVSQNTNFNPVPLMPMAMAMPPPRGAPPPLPPPSVPVSRNTVRWLMYRSKDGDLYFYDSWVNKTQWERPRGLNLQYAVNDRESWLCFRSDHPKNEGGVYFYNKQTGEVTWHQQPECEGLEKQPVNDPKSWMGFRTRTGKVYYHNTITKETSWLKPPYCPDDADMDIKPAADDDKNSRDKVKVDATFKDSGGVQFVIPEFDSDSEDDSEQEAQQLQDVGEGNGNVGNSSTNDKVNKEKETGQGQAISIGGDDEYEEILRKAREEQETQDVSNDYIAMLKEHELQPYSQWAKWMPKFASDPRFLKVPIEERVKIFTTYVRSLIGVKKAKSKNTAKPQDQKKESIKSLRKILNKLKDMPLFQSILHQNFRKTKELAKALKNMNKNQANNVSELTQVISLLADLEDKERKKAFKPFLKQRD